MNKSYRSLWNAALSSWVAVPETARTQSGGKARARTCPGALRRTVLAFAVASAWAMPAAAATLYWDINGITPGLGGTGTWNTTNNFWNTSATGTGGSPSIWNNGALDDAVFDGTGIMAATLGTPITVHNLSFGASSSYTLGGSTLTLAGSTPTINTLGGTHTISATLAGTAGLIKTGVGTLTLAGPNTYTGATRIIGGVLAVSGSLNGTAIDFGGAAAGTQLNATSLNGLTGTTSLSVNSANAMAVLSAANNHTGATNLSGGILRLADGGALANSALTINGDGTTLQLRSDTNTVFATAGGSIGGFGNNDTRNYTIDANQLTSAGAGRTLTLGNLRISTGQSPTLNFTGGNGYTLATGNITSPGAFNLTLNATGVNANIGAVTLTTPAAQALVLGSSSVTGMNTIGAINGNFSVYGDGNGTWQLTAPSSFTGFLAVGRTGANTIQFSDASQLGTGTGSNFIAIQNGATLRYTGTGSQSTTARDLYWNSGAAVIDVTSASANLTFDITGGLRNNQITKAGAGQVTLRKSTAINEITGAPVLITGGILEYNQNNAGAINRFAGAVTGSAGTQIKVSGTGYIGNDNYTADWSANRASLDVGSGAAFDLRGNKVTVDALTGGGTVRNSALNSLTESGVVGYTLTVGVNGGSGTFDGVIRGSLTNTGEHAADAGGPNAIINLAKIGSGTQTFTGANTYAGTTTINAGALQLGNGGTTGNLGSGAVTVAGGASLSFNRSNSYTVGNTISGGGTLAQIGTGTTVLTGTNTYSGATTVSAGSLYVNGDQTGATGLTSVANGATLGGTGTLGGSVAISDGILAPGTSPGTLTINGNLSLTGASRLNYEFGQAGTVGGVLNDLTVVRGNLTLDGTLNVSTSAGGTFGPGLYRVISYGGTLTDNGLVLGTQPAGSTTFVQTAVANQVNLVNTAGLALNFWDGATVPRNNGVVNGGNGTWQASAGNDNWTEATGAINAPYANGAFSIFSAAPGTVTVDNSLGAVVSGGMQFASSDYVVQGGPITLAAGSNTLRVGDGTAPGAGYVATVVSELAGPGGVDKTDLGTLVLAGANSYTGGTTITAGTLQLGNAGTTGSIVGDVTNNGTLAFDRSDDVAFGGAISGAGTVTKLNSATLTLTGDSTYTGGTTITDGTLQLGNAGTTGSIVGNVTNNGTLAFNRSDDVTFGGVISGTGAVTKLGASTLTLTGDSTYTGGTTIAGGTLQLGTGGTSGGIAGDVANNGTLVFNRSNALTFAGSISGAGTVSQIGSGSTTLTGSSGAFAGSTSVTNGALWLDGVLGNAASSLNVATGGTLGGTGTFGGSVTIADGALAPGNSPGNSPGTLTIAGDLALASSSVLAYDYGQSNVVGGSLNDLTVVGRNLTLDGTINFSAPGGGAAGPGLYRVITYGGALTDNGLAIGTQPTGSTLFVQTSVPQQVNLVNTAGLVLNFWDGGNAVHNNGVINGGDGVWQATTGNDNWAESSGAVNAPYASGTFAIFTATPGTVAVDDTLGAVVSGGMQFASSGYRVQGQPITLAAGSNTLRVGDGSGPGASYVATIASALTGAGGIDKTDLGTLVLTGANSYTGGTTISAGTLQISQDTNLGAAGGALNFAGGTLRTTGNISTARTTTISASVGAIDTAAGTTLTHTGSVAGSGALVKAGDGTLVLGADATYGGGTTISGGTLQLGNGGATGSITGDVVNNGALVFDRSNALSFDGAISGSGTVTKLNGSNLTLAGVNSYSGGTALKGGQITIVNSSALGSGALSMDEGTTLAFAADGLHLANAVVLTGTSDPVIDTGAFTETLSGVISGGGALTKNGSGALVLSGGNTYSGATNVALGTLRAAAPNTFSAASAHSVAQFATLDTAGFNQRVAALTNSGTVNLASGVPGSTLTVAGPYVGNGGLLRLGTTLAGSASASDRLVLDGPTAVASGGTRVQIVNLGGLGALTTGNGIEVISATNGATTTAQTTRSAFSLAGGHVDAGAFEYRLIAADALGAGEDWYLRSTTTVVPPVISPPVGEVLPPGAQPTPPSTPPIQIPTYRAEVPLVAALPAQFRQADLAMLGNLHRRMGDEDPAAITNAGTASGATGAGTRRAWGRLVYADLDIEQPGIAQPHSDGRVSGLQVGTDLFVADAWKAGIYVGYLDGSADVSGNARGLSARVGNNDMRSRFLGTYATWMDASGWYVDSVLQGASQRYDVKPDINPRISGKASSFTASIESGKAFALNDRWSIEPQAQLAWQHSSFDDLILGGARVQQDTDSGWIGRLGVRIKGDLATSAGRLQPYGRLNLYYASFGDDVATFVGPAGATAIASGTGYSAAEVAAGATLSLTPATSVYGEVGHLWSIGGDASVKSSVQASVGLKVRW